MIMVSTKVATLMNMMVATVMVAIMTNMSMIMKMTILTTRVLMRCVARARIRRSCELKQNCGGHYTFILWRENRDLFFTFFRGLIFDLKNGCKESFSSFLRF